MILFWLLCVGLVLGLLLGSLARQVPSGYLQVRRPRTAPALALAPQLPARRRTRGRSLSPPAAGRRAGPPGLG